MVVVAMSKEAAAPTKKANPCLIDEIETNEVSSTTAESSSGYATLCLLFSSPVALQAIAAHTLAACTFLSVRGQQKPHTNFIMALMASNRLVSGSGAGAVGVTLARQRFG